MKIADFLPTKEAYEALLETLSEMELPPSLHSEISYWEHPFPAPLPSILCFRSSFITYFRG